MRDRILVALTVVTIGTFAGMPATACELGSGEPCAAETGQAPGVQKTDAAGAPMRLAERPRARATRYRYVGGRSVHARARESFRRARAQVIDKAPPSKENFPVRLFDAAAEKPAGDAPRAGSAQAAPIQAAPTVLQVPASAFPAMSSMPAVAYPVFDFTQAPARTSAQTPAQAPTQAPAATQVLTAAEFNELDRAASPAAGATPVAAASEIPPSSEDSTFAFLARFTERLVEPSGDQGATAIGRMFVGFAVLLAVASALRLIFA